MLHRSGVLDSVQATWVQVQLWEEVKLLFVLHGVKKSFSVKPASEPPELPQRNPEHGPQSPDGPQSPARGGGLRQSSSAQSPGGLHLVFSPSHRQTDPLQKHGNLKSDVNI